MTTHTEGSRMLREKLTPRTPTASSLASRLGVTRQAVSAWILGESRPSAELRHAIEAALGIPAAAWLDDDELALVKRVGGGE